MPELIKCAGCEEPFERAARICLACGARLAPQRSTVYRNFVAAGLLPLLVISYVIRDKDTQIVALAVSLVFIAIILSPKSQTRRQSEMADTLRGQTDFKGTRQFLGCDGKSGIAVERFRNNLCLLTNNGRRVTRRVVSYRDIQSVELIENGRKVLTSVPGEWPGAGVAIDDAATAVLAALTGVLPVAATVWQIDLRIRVRNLPEAIHEVAFLSTDVLKGGIAYGTKNHMARGWYRLIEGLVRKTELEDVRAQDRKRRFRNR